MTKLNNISPQYIIQISLFKYRVCSVRYIQQTLIIGFIVAFVVGIVLYIYFIGHTLLQVGAMLLTVSIVMVCRLFEYWFPKSTNTLIIAFGELQLMQNQVVINYEEIKQLSVQKNIPSNLKIPLIEIKGLTFPKMIVGFHFNYLSHLDFKSKNEVDYWIHSKRDWQLLLQCLKEG